MTGPAQAIGGRSYCLFSSADGTAQVPFPASLSFITQSGATKSYDAGCDDSWHDMTDALWLTTPWTDISGEVGQMDKQRCASRLLWTILSRCAPSPTTAGLARSALQERFMSRRRGVTLIKLTLASLWLLAAPLAQAISVGNLTFSLASDAEFAAKG